jgi:hypothetical protein
MAALLDNKACCGGPQVTYPFTMSPFTMRITVPLPTIRPGFSDAVSRTVNNSYRS